jgi:hypothetical protein
MSNELNTLRIDMISLMEQNPDHADDLMRTWGICVTAIWDGLEEKLAISMCRNYIEELLAQ